MHIYICMHLWVYFIYMQRERMELLRALVLTLYKLSDLEQEA